MSEPGRPDSTEPQADHHVEIVRRIDALAEGGVGSPGLIALGDLAGLYQARSTKRRLENSRERIPRSLIKGRLTEAQAENLIVSKVEEGQAQRQIDLHRVTIPGYDAAHSSAEQLISELRSELDHRHKSQSQDPTEVEERVLDSIKSDLSGAITRAIRR